MKKKIMTLIMALFVFILVACGGQKKQKVSFYNWGGTINKQVLKDFEKETGIEVVYSEFDENERMYTNVKNSMKDYDVIVPSEYMVEKMIKENLLNEIDLSKVPNFKEIANVFKNKGFDPNNKHSIPMYYGTLGILYNKKMVDPKDLNEWDIIFNPKYKGKIYMLDSSRDTLGPGFWKLGYSSNSKDAKQLEEVKKLMTDQKKLVTAYLHDEIKQQMVNKNGALAVVYSGEASEAISENSDLDYYLPKHSNLWLDNFAIVKNATNLENAYKLINYLCDPKVAAKSGNNQATPVTKAREIEPTKSVKSNKVLYPNLDDLREQEVFKDLGDFVEKFEQAWEDVKAN